MNEIRRHGRELLDEARLERTPGAADRERVLGALMASATLAATTTATAAPAVGAKLLTGFSKWLVLAGLAGVVTGSVYLAGHVKMTPPGAKGAAPVADAPGLPAATPTPTPTATAAAAETRPPAPTEPDVRETPRPSVAKRDGQAPSLEAELSALHAAHAAYRAGNAARALELVSEHRTRFPKSQLATERATLEVLSLCRLGRVSDAQSLASRLRKGAGSAAALSGLDGSCAAN